MLLHHTCSSKGISKREHRAGVFAGFACGLACGLILMEVLRRPNNNHKRRQEHALPSFEVPKANPMPFFKKPEKKGPRIINLKK